MIEQPHQRNINLVFICLVVVVLMSFRIMATGSTDIVEAELAIGTYAVTYDDLTNVAERIDSPLQAGKGMSSKHQSYTIYTVEPGDSLYWIAATYGISVEDLQTLNNLGLDVIKVGQRLVVPMDLIKQYPVGVRFSAPEVEWLAQMIHAEARGEPYLGQVAVGAVIINRILSTQFPNTLRGVLFQNNAFQPVRNGSFYSTPNESARKAALEALNGHDPTGGALYFFNPRASEDRFMHSRPTQATIGRHRFTN